jgi:hypothetical protein
MSTHSLDQRLRELEQRILDGKSFGPTADMPFGIFVYAPTEEQELRRQVELSATRLTNQGRPVCRVDLGELMWDCLREHPAGPSGLAMAEQYVDTLGPVLSEAHTMLVGKSNYEPGPLEQRIIDRLQVLDPKTDIAYLVRAGELFPLYRTSALLERLLGRVKVQTLLFYPGVLYGTAELRFMGVSEPSPNYRPTIYN